MGTQTKEDTMIERILAYFFVATGDVRNAIRRDEGATAVEYGLLVALIAAVIIAVVIILGDDVRAAFQTIVDGW
jgi:pilus assembly protein Flp/PilA